MTNLVGTTLGQYQIVELIGEGGMAIVYKAWQPSLRRYVALKVLAPHLASDAEFIQRFHQEAVSAANLKQTNIVTIHDVGAESGYHYIAMELIEGASLEAYIRSGQPFTPDQVAGIISQIGAALDYAHQRGFIHRDIKPANILIETSGRAVLTDFGIVKALSGSGVTAALTQAGTVVGTPHYMSPEQITDEPLDHRSDLYALGIVCYEMLSGQVPFDGATTHAIIYAQVHTPPPPLREIAGLAVPPPVEAVVNKMLAKRRENRYDSGGEFARDLAQAVSGVWPAGLCEETEVTMPMGTGTTVMEPTPGGMPAPTALQPTPAAPYTPTAYTPTPPPMPAPARRRRWPLVLGGIAAIGVMLIVGVVVGMLVLGAENPLNVIQAALALKSAQTALADGDDAEAVDKFSQVLESDPDNTEALEGQLEAAANLAQAGQFDDVIAAYEAVWQAKPGEVQALRGLGQSYEAQEEWGEAAVWYEKWVQVEPDNPDALLALGWAEYKLEHHESAVAQFSRASGLAPDQPAIFLGLGYAYLGQGDYDSSLESAGQALDLAPDGSPEQNQAVQLLEDLADADLDAEPLLVLSDWYAGQEDEAALQQVNQRILEPIPHPMDVTLGDQIRFLGYEIWDLPDGQVQVNLYFQAMAAMDADYTVWLHAYVHGEDITILPPGRQQYGFDNWDHRMSDPTSRWVEGATYRDRTVREAAPGEYRFVFGVYLPDLKTRLTTLDDPETGAIDLGWQLVGTDGVDVRVLSRYGWEKFENGELEEAQEAFEAALAKEPDNLDALLGAGAVYGARGESKRLSQITDRLLPLVPNRQDVLFGDVVRFIGYEIQTLEDDQVQVDLYFQAVAQMDADYTVWLHAHVHQEDIALLPPERQQYGAANLDHHTSPPTSRWIEGVIYRDRTVRELAAGEYHFIFGLYSLDLGTRLATPDDPEYGAVDLGWHAVGGE